MPYAAARLHVPLRRVDHDLAEVLEFVVGDDAYATGRPIRELPLGERAWIGVLIRDGDPYRVEGGVVLQPGDRVHIYAQPEDAPALQRIFEGRASELTRWL